MNIAFSKIIKLGDRQWEFNFRKLPAETAHFHADVTDAKGNRIFFNMQKSADGGWRANGTNLPVWIIAGEILLGQSIEEEVGQSSL